MNNKILESINEALGKPTPGRNSMGCSESFYNPYYMVGMCFEENELQTFTELELEKLIKLAEFASDVFY